MGKLTNEELLHTVLAVQEAGSQRKAEGVLGLDQSQISRHMKEAKERGLYSDPQGSIEVMESKVLPLPPEGKKAVYYLTCAQNQTKIHHEFWVNLKALVQDSEVNPLVVSSQLMVSAIKYNKDALGQRRNAKCDTYKSREDELVAEYDRELLPYITDDRVRIARNLTFCAELNIIPTASNPLGGLENYTYRESTVVPHPKLAMESIPTMKTEGVKLMYTTGAVTQRNYIKRAVGYKAEHFHAYGALIVEVNDKGNWWCRQITQGEDGRAYDLDRCAYKGKVTTGHRVADLCWEVHAEKIDPIVAEAAFGHNPQSMLEVLRPETQHVHDILDFSGRSHHTRKDPHEVFRAFKEGRWELTGELERTAGVLWQQIARPWCETVVVNSNHDRHLAQWLREADWRFDPANAKMILALNLIVLQDIEAKRPTNLTRVALSLGWDKLKPSDKDTCPVRFLAEDESDIILGHIQGGIECGLHGDRGANGAKGAIRGIAKTDRKTNMGDKHVAAIVNHVYCCGFVGLLDQGYNHGLSSWTHATTVTYKNGTRSIVSFWKGKWRA